MLAVLLAYCVLLVFEESRAEELNWLTNQFRVLINHVDVTFSMFEPIRKQL